MDNRVILGNKSFLAYSRFIKRTAHGKSAAIEDVRVDHGGFHILVAEEFLHGADIVAVLKQVGGERVAEDVGRDVLLDTGAASGAFEGLV